MNPALQRVYEKIPAIRCKRLCQEACGPIAMSGIEHEQMIAVHGTPLPSTSASCPFLAPDGQCSVYPVRPLICRLWGVVRKLRCPHGCIPDRWLSDDDSSQLLDAIEQLDPTIRCTHPGIKQMLESIRDRTV